MITLAVTATLARPAIVERPVHLDALLTARHPAMHGSDGTLTRLGGTLRIAPLPLAVARAGQSWVWCATAASGAASGSNAIVKRRDGVDYLMTSRTVYPAVGPDRDRLMRFPITQDEIRFLAAVPQERDIKELRRLLNRVDQIGALRKSGYGVVAEWRIDPVEMDPRACLLDGEGQSRRTLPATMLESAEAPERMSVLPPYWQGAETCPAFPPGTRGALCPSIIITSSNTLR